VDPRIHSKKRHVPFQSRLRYGAPTVNFEEGAITINDPRTDLSGLSERLSSMEEDRGKEFEAHLSLLNRIEKKIDLSNNAKDTESRLASPNKVFRLIDGSVNLSLSNLFNSNSAALIKFDTVFNIALNFIFRISVILSLSAGVYFTYEFVFGDPSPVSVPSDGASELISVTQRLSSIEEDLGSIRSFVIDFSGKLDTAAQNIERFGRIADDINYLLIFEFESATKTIVENRSFAFNNYIENLNSIMERHGITTDDAQNDGFMCEEGSIFSSVVNDSGSESYCDILERSWRDVLLRRNEWASNVYNIKVYVHNYFGEYFGSLIFTDTGVRGDGGERCPTSVELEDYSLQGVFNCIHKLVGDIHECFKFTSKYFDCSGGVSRTIARNSPVINRFMRRLSSDEGPYKIVLRKFSDEREKIISRQK